VVRDRAGDDRALGGLPAALGGPVASAVPWAGGAPNVSRDAVAYGLPVIGELYDSTIVGPVTGYTPTVCVTL
jgi:hypothetical protein